MPRPIENAIREEIIQRHEQGETLRAISEALAMSYETVKHVWQHWKRHGKVEPNYERAKQRGTRQYQRWYEAVMELKRAHPRWGAKLILLELGKTEASQAAYPSERTVQRWFAAARVPPPVRGRHPRTGDRKRGAAPHAVWAVDTKELLTLGDGSGASWLTITDEYTGAILHAVAFPPQAVAARACASRPGDDEDRL